MPTSGARSRLTTGRRWRPAPKAPSRRRSSQRSSTTSIIQNPGAGESRPTSGPNRSAPERWRSPRSSFSSAGRPSTPPSPSPLRSSGSFFLGLTAILLVTDLKRPDRFLYILTKPNPTSWLVWGSYMLMLAGGAALVWLIAALAGASGLRKGFMIVALCLAPLAAGYTAFLFGQAEGRDLWQSL